MDFKQFKKQIQNSIPNGTRFDNPGGGTSTVSSYLDNNISYIRGNSTICVSLRDLFDAYSHFKDQRVTSSDLKVYAPTVFESKQSGHSCNCTFLFLILQHLGIVDRISGTGVKNSPFFVEING